MSHHVLASASEDGTALLYDTSARGAMRRIEVRRGTTARPPLRPSLPSDFHAPLLLLSLQLGVAVTALSFASDGVHLACGTEHGELLLFDLRSSRSEARPAPLHGTSTPLTPTGLRLPTARYAIPPVPAGCSSHARQTRRIRHQPPLPLPPNSRLLHRPSGRSTPTRSP